MTSADLGSVGSVVWSLGYHYNTMDERPSSHQQRGWWRRTECQGTRLCHHGNRDESTLTTIPSITTRKVCELNLFSVSINRVMICSSTYMTWLIWWIGAICSKFEPQLTLFEKQQKQKLKEVNFLPFKVDLHDLWIITQEDHLNSSIKCQGMGRQLTLTGTITVVKTRAGTTYMYILFSYKPSITTY